MIQKSFDEFLRKPNCQSLLPPSCIKTVLIIKVQSHQTQFETWNRYEKQTDKNKISTNKGMSDNSFNIRTFFFSSNLKQIFTKLKKFSFCLKRSTYKKDGGYKGASLLSLKKKEIGFDRVWKL